MPKLPSLQFYPKDWLSDSISWCSIAAQGLWLRMLFIMHDSGRYGHLCNRDGSPLPPAFVARACGTDLVQYESLLAELDDAGVLSRNKREVIFSRRLLRDQERRKQFQKSKEKERQSKSNNSEHKTYNRVNTESTQSPPSLHLQSVFALAELNTKANPASRPPPGSELEQKRRIEARDRRELAERSNGARGQGISIRGTPKREILEKEKARRAATGITESETLNE